MKLIDLFKRDKPKKKRTVDYKKLQWVRHRKRLHDALISNAYSNQLNQMKINLQLLTPEEFSKFKYKLLQHCIRNASEECAFYLLEDASTPIQSVNFVNFYLGPLMDCEYKKIHLVYDLLEKIQNKFDFVPDLKLSLYKRSIISRLVDPDKIGANKLRVEYIHELLKTGFLNFKDVREQVERVKGSSKNLALVSLLRELTFKELGI